MKIGYESCGQGNAVVLLHGFLGSSRYWQDIIPRLCPHVHVIAPDLRGHGQSDAPDEPYSMESMADDVAELLALLNVRKAAMFGHSMGGYVTLAFADRHADRLAAFGLIHSTAYADDEKGKQNRANTIGAIRNDGIAKFADGFAPRLFAPEHVETMPERVEIARQIGRATDPVGAIRATEAMRDRPDRNETIRRADVPVLLVAGQRDQLVAVERTFSVSKPSVVQHTIPDAGHMSMLEQPEQLAEAMLAFLRRAGFLA